MVPEPLQGPVVRTVQEGLRSSAHVGRAALARQVAGCATRAGLFVWERSPHHEGYILQYVIFKVDTLQDCVVIQRIACGH